VTRVLRDVADLGNSFLLIKVAVDEVSPAVVALARSGLGTAVLLPIALSL
jgi:hypothetical protein